MGTQPPVTWPETCFISSQIAYGGDSGFINEWPKEGLNNCVAGRAALQRRAEAA